MILFRRAGFEDLEILARTRQKAWATTYRGIYSDASIDQFDLQWHIERDRKRMMDKNQEFWLVMDEKECVGYFYYGTPHVPLKDHTFCLNALYFLPEYRGKGLGSRVFSMIREICKERGIPKFFNGCNTHNLPARAFYQKMGGVVDVICDGHENLAEDQMYFEYDLTKEENSNEK